MEFDASTAEPVAAAVEPQFDPESAAPVSGGGKTQKEPSNPFALNEKEFAAASPLGRLKMMLSHPWDKYVASVDQGFKGPEIPRVEADRGGGAVARAGQVGAALDNTVAGAASGIISPGGVTAILNPATIVYSAPRFAAGGVEHIIDAVKGAISGEDTVQQTVEKGVGGALMLAGGVHGVKSGLRAASVPKTPEQAIELIRTEADKTTEPTAKAALEGAAEKISATAQKGVAFDPSTAEPLNPVTREEINAADQKLKDEFAARNQPALTEGPTVGDLGAYAKFGGFKIQPVGDGVWDIRIEGDPTPKIYTRDQLQGAGWAVDKLPEATPEVKKAGPQKIADIQTALADQDTVPQLSVWPRDAVPEGKSRLLQVDFPSPNAKGAAGDGNYSSASPALLREMGVDIPEPPEWLPPGSYSIDQVREAIKAGPPAETAEVGLGAASPKEFQPVRESATSLKNAAVDAERKARGAPPLMEAAKRGFGETWDQAMKAIDENQNVADELVARLKEKPAAITDVQQAILLHREIDLKNQLDRVTKNLAENIGTEDSLASDRINRARILDELSDLEEASQSAGTETSRGLNARKLIAKEDYSLAKMLTDRRAEKGGAKLTDAEIKEVEAQHAAIEEAQRALDEHEAQQELADAITTPEQAGEEITKLEKEIKSEDVKAKKENKTPEDKTLSEFKRRTQKRIEEIKNRIESGDFSKSKARRAVELDEEAIKLKADLKRAQQKFQETLLKDRLANRTSFEKFQDTFVKWRRGFLLSSPVTLAKLSSAAVQRMVFTPIEEAIGGAIGKAIPGVASRAPREGGFNVTAEARAITQGLTKGMRDAAELMKKGKTDLEVLFGKGRDGAIKESDVTPRSVIDFFGEVHGALKSPTKRAEFTRSLEKRMAWNIKQGIDVTDPLVQTRIMVEAYKDANRSIFLQDNVVVNAYNRAIGALLEKQKSTGQPSTAGKVIATVTKVLLPIVRVPTNIVAETITYATGSVTGSFRLARIIGRETSKLSPEQADLVMRELKKGSLGAAVILVGYFNADSIGGYYQSGQTRRDKDVPYGSIKVSGHNVPSYLLHNPLMETLQLGATIKRVEDSKLHKKDQEKQGLPAGTFAAALGLIEEVPFVRQQVETAKMLDSREGPYARGEFIKGMVVPAASDFVARQLDKDAQGNVIQRKPTTVFQHIETGIPGLRQNVPTKGGVKQMGYPAPKKN